MIKISCLLVVSSLACAGEFPVPPVDFYQQYMEERTELYKANVMLADRARELECQLHSLRQDIVTTLDIIFDEITRIDVRQVGYIEVLEEKILDQDQRLKTLEEIFQDENSAMRSRVQELEFKYERHAFVVQKIIERLDTIIEKKKAAIDSYVCVGQHVENNDSYSTQTTSYDWLYSKDVRLPSRRKPLSESTTHSTPRGMAAQARSERQSRSTWKN